MGIFGQKPRIGRAAAVKENRLVVAQAGLIDRRHARLVRREALQCREQMYAQQSLLGKCLLQHLHSVRTMWIYAGKAEKPLRIFFAEEFDILVCRHPRTLCGRQIQRAEDAQINLRTVEPCKGRGHACHAVVVQSGHIIHQLILLLRAADILQQIRVRIDVNHFFIILHRYLQLPRLPC